MTSGEEVVAIKVLCLMVLIYGAWPSALGWIAVISWSFMLTVGPNMGTTKNKQNRLSFLLNIFNTRNYILNRILDGHFRGDTKQEKLLSFL